MQPEIGGLNESSLHRTLKQFYADNESQIEQTVGRFVVDVVKPGEFIEIQTRNFSSIRSKCAELLNQGTLRLVHPIPTRTSIVKIQGDKLTKPRLSPKRGTLFDLFAELVAIPRLLLEKNFSVEVVMFKEEQIWIPAVKRYRRHGWSVINRRLLEVKSYHTFDSASDLWALVDSEISPRFTTQDLAQTANINRALAQKMAYCLRQCEVIDIVSKQGNSLVYEARR